MRLGRGWEISRRDDCRNPDDEGPRYTKGRTLGRGPLGGGHGGGRHRLRDRAGGYDDSRGAHRDGHRKGGQRSRWWRRRYDRSRDGRTRCSRAQIFGGKPRRLEADRQDERGRARERGARGRIEGSLAPRLAERDDSNMPSTRAADLFDDRVAAWAVRRRVPLEVEWLGGGDRLGTRGRCHGRERRREHARPQGALDGIHAGIVRSGAGDRQRTRGAYSTTGRRPPRDARASPG